MVNQSSETAEPQLRADARRNRALILQAAEAAFAADGLGVPVDEIARRAGVGAGTLYRHFPTKEDLFEAVVISHMERIADEGEALADSADPVAALFEFVAHLGAEATSKRNLMEALAGSGIDLKAKAKGTSDRVGAALGVLLKRGQEAGSVRPDVTTEDLLGLVMGTCVLGHSVDAASQNRMLSIVCAGLRSKLDGPP